MADLSLVLKDINGKEETLYDITEIFEVGFVFVPPGRDLGGFIPVFDEIFKTLAGSAMMCSLVIALPQEQAQEVVEPYKKDLDKVKIFTDENGALAKSLGINSVPSFVHVGIGGKIVSQVEGWQIDSWQGQLNLSAKHLKWTSPQLYGQPNLPAPFTLAF